MHICKGYYFKKIDGKNEYVEANRTIKDGLIWRKIIYGVYSPFKKCFTCYKALEATHIQTHCAVV